MPTSPPLPDKKHRRWYEFFYRRRYPFRDPTYLENENLQEMSGAYVILVGIAAIFLILWYFETI